MKEEKKKVVGRLLGEMYSAYDCQNQEYFHTGMNSLNKKECEEDIIQFLTLNEKLNDEDWDIPNDVILEMFEVEIHKHSKLLPEKD